MHASIVSLHRHSKSHASHVRHTHLTIMSRSHTYLCQILYLSLAHFPKLCKLFIFSVLNYELSNISSNIMFA